MAELVVRRRGGEVCTILVDDVDLDRVSAAGRWSIAVRRHTSYAEHRFDGRLVMLHRWLLDAPKGVPVDHVNGNGLDNRRANLRLCTYSENGGNSQIHARNTSGFKGVCWNAREGKWMAYIGGRRTRKYLGYFQTAEAASAAYRRASGEFFGEFANVEGCHEGR